MNLETPSLQKRLYLVSAMVLLVGLGSAVLVYLSAANASDSSMIQDFENSKMYIHDLELFGGKMNVLMDQFRRWFDGLWHGKSLALTISCITIFISLMVSLVAYHLPSLRSGAPDDNQRGGE